MSKNDELLKHEFKNKVYDTIGEGISYTAKKYHYKKYDIAKLIMAMYVKDFDYITSDNDYREQIKILDEYFTKTYHHRLITFEMVKAIYSFKGTETYNKITNDVANYENTIVRDNNLDLEDINVLKTLMDAGEYDELMTRIEKEQGLCYSVAIVYDKIKREME